MKYEDIRLERERIKQMENEKRVGEFVLEQARRAWESHEKFRVDRERNKRYTYGRQWDDRIYVDGRYITEEQYIKEQGNLPLKNNLIRRLVRNVLGVFHNSRVNPVCVARDKSEAPYAEVVNKLLECNRQLNRMDELYSRSLEEFLISGFVVHRKWYGRRGGSVDCWTDCVSPDNFFMDSAVSDYRGWDVNCVGEIHDLSFADLCTSLARSSEDVERFREIYVPEGEPAAYTGSQFGDTRIAGSFFSPSRPGMCRTIEVWRREHRQVLMCHDTLSGRLCERSMADYNKIEDENRARRAKGEKEIKTAWRIKEFWRYYYLSPYGHILRSGDSPYPQGSHPYVFKAYPFIDGEIHSFVADVIDQQRYTNRLISLYDWIMRASAKGVLLFPEGAMPDGVDISDVADEWSRFNGVITYRPKPGMPLPQQVSSNATNIGITELLNIQLKMFEDISGINGALQGKLESGSVSGTLFDQQTRNSLTSLSDLLESFNMFILDGVIKDAANIRKFYTEEKVRSIVGSAGDGFLYDRADYGDTESDFSFIIRFRKDMDN